MSDLLGLYNHRPPAEWLEDLCRSQELATKQDRPKITIPDLIDRVPDPNAPSQPIRPTSPRSVQAMLSLGIDQNSLVYKPLSVFKELGIKDDDMAQVAFEHFEHVRMEQLQSLSTERQRIIDEGGDPGPSKKAGGGGGGGGGGGKGDTADMVEKERARLEVLKRRQEKEMQQLIGYEMMRKEIQAKAQEKLKRQEERQKAQEDAKKEAEKRWRQDQFEREQRRLQEEERLELESRRLEAERFRREQIERQKEMEEEKRRKKEAYAKEKERQLKAEMARKETERILAQQQREVELRKKEMQRRDHIREEAKLQRQRERAAENEEARKKAEARLLQTVEANKAILRAKREDFERRETEAEKRRMEREQQRLKAEEEKAHRHAMKARHRQQKYQEAQNIMAQRIDRILKKADDKEQSLQQLQLLRHHENELRKLRRSLDMGLKVEKVEIMKKMQMYRRALLLDKIMSETARTCNLLSERQKLQLARKDANLQASMQRQALVSAMEQMQRKNKMFNSINAVPQRPGTS